MWRRLRFQREREWFRLHPLHLPPLWLPALLLPLLLLPPMLLPPMLPLRPQLHVSTDPPFTQPHPNDNAFAGRAYPPVGRIRR